MSGRARRATRPTPCLFGATPGLRADCSRITRGCSHRTRGGFALRLAGARLGKDPESGGGINRGVTDSNGDTTIPRASTADARDPQPVRADFSIGRKIVVLEIFDLSDREVTNRANREILKLSNDSR
jgi:hypothetical protein